MLQNHKQIKDLIETIENVLEEIDSNSRLFKMQVPQKNNICTTQ